MDAIGASLYFLLFAVSVHCEVFTHSAESCHCYYCNVTSKTGSCLNKTACKILDPDKGNSTTQTVPTEWSSISLTTNSSSYPTPFYSCDVNCRTVNVSVSYCTRLFASAPFTFAHSGDKPVTAICTGVGISAVAILGLIGILAFHRAKRMEKRKKDPRKPLPTVEDLDVSIRMSPTTGQLTISASQSNSDGNLEACEQQCVATSPTPNCNTSRSQCRLYKEDWTIATVNKTGPSIAETSRPSPSHLVTDKANGRPANQTQPTYTNVGPTSEDNDHNYINTEGLINGEDEENTPNSPDYVNTPSRNSADDDDFDYENVDASVTTARVTATVPKISVQENSSVIPQPKGLIQTSPGKAVSFNWLASITEEKAASMDSVYIDMNRKSKVKPKAMLSPKLMNKGTVPATIFASAPDVRMVSKRQPVLPIYENQAPAVPRKPNTRTIQDLLTATNLR